MTRIGFHYFPDTNHYRQSDLDLWLPELLAMRARWLVLIAPAERAIPEPFLRGLVEAGIEPVLHFQFSPDRIPPHEDLNLLCKIYARWGVRYVTLFDMPNLRSVWETTAWAQTDLVERFLDIYLPSAEISLRAGLIPVFPPLKPGGDYWDTAFLPAALAGIQRRGHQYLLEKLVIGAYAWSGERSLNWGAGGPERWPGSRPYFTPEGEEDQRGFRIFDWYNALTQSVLVEPRPVFLFGMGSSLEDDPHQEAHTYQNMTMARLLDGEPVSGFEPLSQNVIGGAFWLLSAVGGHPQAGLAWYPPQGEALPIVNAVKTWAEKISETASPPSKGSFSIAHYLLLPSFDGSISDYYLDLIRPILKKYKPTFGFSITEASQAKRVTIMGGPEIYPEEIIHQLRAKGCIVHRIDETGTLIAP